VKATDTIKDTLQLPEVTEAFDRAQNVRGLQRTILLPRFLRDLQIVRYRVEHVLGHLMPHTGPGAPRKNAALDTALLGLARLWTEVLQLDCGPQDVEHSSGSHFIRMAAVALGPFIPQGELGHDALARRWVRLKEHGAEPKAPGDDLATEQAGQED
jgi:hypothetical protein